MKIDQENISMFNKQIEDIRYYFSHEIYGQLTDYFIRTGNNIEWTKNVSDGVRASVEMAAKKYLIYF